MKKILAVLVALILCLSFVVACTTDSETGETEKSVELDEKVLSTAGDYKVTQALYNFCYYMVYVNWAGYEQYYGPDWLDQVMDDGTTMGESMKSVVRDQVEELVAGAVLANERYEITRETVKEKVESEKALFVESFGTKEEYARFLSLSHTTDKGIETYFELYEILNLLSEKISEEGEECYVSDEEVKEEFDKQYYGKLKVQHILISTNGDGISAPQRSDEEAMSIVNEVLSRIEAGEDFDFLIEEYDEDPGMTPGNYYVFGDGEMVPEFETASKQLTPGDYTKQAVKTDYGYHIIKRYPLDSTSEEYLQCKLYIARTLKLTPIIQAKAETLGITWDNASIDEYVDKWMDEVKAQNTAQ